MRFNSARLFAPDCSQVMLRVSSPDAADFWVKRCGFTHIHKYSFKEWGFDLDFVASLDADQAAEFAKVKAEGKTEQYLWSMDGTVLELTYNHDSDEVYWPGNNKLPEGLEGDALKKAEETKAGDDDSITDGFGHVSGQECARFFII